MEKALLNIGLSFVLASVAARNHDNNTEETNASFYFPHTQNDSQHPVRHLSEDDKRNFTMTYKLMDDLHPDGLDLVGEGEGHRHYNAAETGGWMSECRSNRTELWQMTWPVCSTRFTSLVVFVLVTAVLAVITLWTILGNILVLCALYRYRCLRTMSNCLIGNLAVSDLLLAVTVLPISTANDVLGYWVFGNTMCTLWLSIDVLYCTASIWGLCTIAFDRYTATVYPVWYHDKRSPKKALAYMVFVWLFSIVISLAPFIGWQDMISGFYIHDATINRYMCILFSTQSYVIYSAMGSFILPSCFMSFLYVKIFVVLHRQADQLKKKSSITSEFSSQIDPDGPTFAMHDGRHSDFFTRDFTASSFVAEDAFVGKEREIEWEDREEGEEGGNEEDDEDSEKIISPTRTRFELDDKVTGQGQKSPDRMPDEACRGLLQDQNNSSLSTALDNSRPDSARFSFHQKDAPAVSCNDSPVKLSLKKSRLSALSLPNNANGTCAGVPFLPRVLPHSKSTSAFCRNSDQPEDLENGRSARVCLRTQRSSLRWSKSKRKSYAMTISMRRRFQLREQRATKRMLLIMACFFVCWIPFTLMYMLRSLCPRCKHLDDHVTAFIIWLGYVNSSLNPLLYTLFNDDFRKAFKKLLGLYRPKRTSRTE